MRRLIQNVGRRQTREDLRTVSRRNLDPEARNYRGCVRGTCEFRNAQAINDDDRIGDLPSVHCLQRVLIESGSRFAFATSEAQPSICRSDVDFMRLAKSLLKAGFDTSWCVWSNADLSGYGEVRARDLTGNREIRRQVTGVEPVASRDGHSLDDTVRGIVPICQRKRLDVLPVDLVLGDAVQFIQVKHMTPRGPDDIPVRVRSLRPPPIGKRVRLSE